MVKLLGQWKIAKDITKVMNMYDQIVDLRSQLAETHKKNKFSEGTATYHFSDLIGNSPAFKQAISLAKKAARTHSPSHDLWTNRDREGTGRAKYT
ncbi:hypothetical protein RCO48_23125 [Peribacillus frigoritolerans]|nr:hypothetical protein [Peribacillus frigoritolerans]